MSTIRKGKRSDLPTVYDLVIELAIYEKEPDAVTATLAAYEKAFDEDRINLLIAEEDGEIKGMALYYWTFSTWKGPMMYLEDFVVRESCRGKGIGQKLFDAFIEDSKDQNVVMTKWQVIEWNEPAIRFYKKNKATIEKNWLNGKIIFEN